MVVVKGRTDAENMCYVVTFSAAAINTQLQTLGHSLREWELNDRTGLLLPFKIETEEDLSDCDWGRQPKGKGKGNGKGGGGATLGNFMQGGAQLGQQQSGGAQLGHVQLGQQQLSGGAQLGQQQQQQSGGAQLGQQQLSGGAQVAQQQQSGGAAPLFGSTQWVQQQQQQQSGGAAQSSGGQQQRAGVVADPWQGQSLGASPNPGQQPAGGMLGNTGWSNYSGPEPPGSRVDSSLQTYANTAVTPIAPGGVCTVTNADGTPYVQPPAS